MIEINPHALYSRSDLIELLKPCGIKADSFIAKIRPAKRFQMAWFGLDLLDAIAAAPRLEGRKQKAASVVPVRRRRGRPRKEEKSEADKICGRWTREELGLA